ncbi:MAG: phosphopantothenate/pantothenate synthetase [Euryarchaeota archaeon]|jgi:4-phosphopantoate--beta-alanine ligase|nr:phosphopantothenate/pantothenate synthetase [Euryarchaeota archaeon]NCF96543.1 phosphopantothenate/pantothenate synthetase [Euryarchaeota archaeon]
MNEEEVVDPEHPRYQSLMIRKKIAEAGVKGMLADSAMIAHGRGEAFDYLLGEQTIPSALDATREAAARLVKSNKPVLSLNGNAIALAGQEFLTIASQLGCPIEINIFYRTPQRMGALIGHLKMLNQKLDLDVEIMGGIPDARIPGLEGPRGACQQDGIFEADTVLVPLEDGDRCEALMAMGKTVLVIDLNPISRSSRGCTVGIVDEVTRVAKNLIQFIPQKPAATDWNNDRGLQSALDHIVETMSNRF